VTVTKFVDLITRIPNPLSLHFYDFSMIFLHFRISLVYTGNLANTPLNKKKEITTGPFAGLLRRGILPVVFCDAGLTGAATGRRVGE